MSSKFSTLIEVSPAPSFTCHFSDSRYSDIAGILGTTKRIVAKDSKTFGKEIAKYIDSKDQKRGDKKDKKSKDKNDKPKEKSLMDKVREAAGQSIAAKNAKQSSKSKDDEPALWPLIRQVNVRCPAKALSTGAILVDLPGLFCSFQRAKHSLTIF
jgi:hypothetical protein